MKIVKLKGGLGNQMFQYSFAFLLKELTGDEVKLDVSAYNSGNQNDDIRQHRISNFRLSLPIASHDEVSELCLFEHIGTTISLKNRVLTVAESLLNKRYFLEKNRAYINPESIINYTYYDGYWQSWRYVQAVQEKLKEDFIPNSELSLQTKEMIAQVCNSNSVFVGVRRGDYTREISHYGLFESDYYERAMNIIEKQIDAPIYYIFSNDINWCKKNLNYKNRRVFFREKNTQVSDFEELILMSNFNHAIIPNSTFHWWGAALNHNVGKIVVCPQKWFNDNKPIDITPPEWIKI